MPVGTPVDVSSWPMAEAPAASHWDSLLGHSGGSEEARNASKSLLQAQFPTGEKSLIYA
jgi:hypothetical protein